MRTNDESEAADVFDFIDEYLSDVEGGREHALSHYLARYARSQDAISREYLALKYPRAQAADDARPGSDGAGATTRDDAQRVGPYRIVRELGRGGQGTVFLADDLRLERRVALKVLASRFDSVSGERRARFRREAQVIARLEHPCICGIYEADIDGELPYIAMRYVEGPTLAELLGRARQQREQAHPQEHAQEHSQSSSWCPRTAVDLHQVLYFFERAARALHAAHEAGVVHRDVKPGNVIVAADGRPVLLDFGLARDEQSDLATLTRSGETFGTPAYMSPEQLRGGDDALDRRTDVYSLGATMYEALTLQRPFEAAQRAELYAAIEHQPLADARLANPQLPQDVEVVLQTALEKDKQRRYASALELAEDLRRIRQYEPIHARPAGVALRFARMTRRHPVLSASISVIILALSSGLVLALALLRREQRALDFALGRHLAERCVALVAQDPSAALTLGVEAMERAPNYLTRSALFSALEACQLQHVLAGDPARRVLDLAVSPDRRLVATALDDGTARLFDIESGALVHKLVGNGGAVREARFSPDGKLLAIALENGGLAIFDAHSAELVRELKPDPVQHGFAAIEFARGPARMLAIARSGAVCVWDSATWQRVLTLDQGPGGIEHAHFAPAGDRIVTSAAATHAKARSAIMWDAASGARLFELAGHTDALVACDFNTDPEHPLVATAARDRCVRIFDARDGRQVGDALAHERPIGLTRFSPDSQRLLTTTEDGEQGTALLWDLARGTSVPIAGHAGQQLLDAAFSNDGTRLATVSFDCTARIWDAHSGVEQRRLPTLFRPLAVRWSCDDNRLLTMTNGSIAQVWYAINRPDMFDLCGHTDAVETACFSPDGTRALTASSDHTARLWFVPCKRNASERTEPGAQLCVLQHAAPVTAACFSTDGAAVLTISEDRTAALWRTSDGQRIGAPLVHPDAVLAGSFDPAGARILTICADGRARMWKNETALLPSDCDARSAHDFDDAPATRVLCGAFSPDGARVALGCEDDHVRVYDARTRRLLWETGFARTAPELGGVVALAFHPGGTDIAAACGDRRVRFFDASNGASARRDLILFVPKSLAYGIDGRTLLLLGNVGGNGAFVFDLASERRKYPEVMHNDDIASGCLSLDGTLVLTAAHDGTANVWDARSGRPVSQRITNAAPLRCASFNADHDELRVIVSAQDGRVSVWPVDPLPAAKARKPRELDPGEKLREQSLALPLRYE